MTVPREILPEQIGHYNTISRYLAMRDVASLTSDELLRSVGEPAVELLIVLGNSVPFITEQAAAACRKGIARQLMIAGGIGHATPHLVASLAKHPDYRSIPTNGRSEAEMLRDVAVQSGGLAADAILLETQSTNCGNNASFALETLRALGRPLPRTILLMQDPTLQRRTDASFKAAWSNACEAAAFVNYAAFVPGLRADPGSECGAMLAATGSEAWSKVGGPPWEMERYLSLVLGEIPRLRDDETGYGPRGRGYIGHVDVPSDVLASFEALRNLDPERVRAM